MQTAKETSGSVLTYLYFVYIFQTKAICTCAVHLSVEAGINLPGRECTNTELATQRTVNSDQSDIATCASAIHFHTRFHSI